MPTITQWAKDLGVIFSELKGNMEWIDSKIESQASEQRFRELIQEALQTRISEQTCRELIQEARQAEKDMIHRLVHDAIRNKWRTQGLSFQADLSMLQEKITGLQLSVSQCLKNHGGGQEKGNQKKQDPESPLAREPPSALTRPSNRERIVALEAENLQFRTGIARIVAQKEELLAHLLSHDKKLAVLDKKLVVLDQNLVARNNLLRTRNRRLAELSQRTHRQNGELIKLFKAILEGQRDFGSGIDGPAAANFAATSLAAANLAAANLGATRPASPGAE